MREVKRDIKKNKVVAATAKLDLAIAILARKEETITPVAAKKRDKAPTMLANTQ
jgi:hypothetical protein